MHFVKIRKPQHDLSGPNSRQTHDYINFSIDQWISHKINLRGAINRIQGKMRQQRGPRTYCKEAETKELQVSKINAIPTLTAQERCNLQLWIWLPHQWHAHTC